MVQSKNDWAQLPRNKNDYPVEGQNQNPVLKKIPKRTLIAQRYEIIEHLADGGMASVYKAWDRRVDRPVAIKVLPTIAKTNVRIIERFRREARTAAALAHPNAVSIYDFIQESEQYFLVMEFINGPTLKQLIAQRRQLLPREALEVGAQICAVLQLAHSRGFIHRDIKPQNIMLTSGGSNGRALVKLTDFGIVQIAEAAGLTTDGIVLGTADYLSPEQARGERLTGSSDLYSLGVVLFEMLTGRLPFVAASAIAVAMLHSSSKPPLLRQFNTNIPLSVEQIVLKTLDKNPKDRFKSALEMERILRDCAEELKKQQAASKTSIERKSNYNSDI